MKLDGQTFKHFLQLDYIKANFARHRGITNDKSQAPTLVLYDDHINVTLAYWAKREILFSLYFHLIAVT